MAQKREKEETELKVPETIPLRTPTITGTDDPTHASDPKLPNFNGSRPRSDLVSQPQPEKKPAGEDNNRRSMKRLREEANRCSGIGCRRKVGLIGFRCRCGEVFCYEHRYSDRHSCSYDYKAAGREAIARENPVVRAAKLVKV
ncbi:zinc finger A20 and AN1 domain-containing stress-associated protein 5 [Nicotiana tabacum]|uniref:Zinc finger A20 and AN1 domain-containing stress-associated protein 5 n=1 Tax=Nicotiana tabacum TaxID=4097 RepID=A0AC58TCX7_TOBAC|nr:zinc finger A20 and AN1 domain-containing stress-associated protein 5-like [Nicotiana tomentosiformis]